MELYIYNFYKEPLFYILVKTLENAPNTIKVQRKL